MFFYCNSGGEGDSGSNLDLKTTSSRRNLTRVERHGQLRDIILTHEFVVALFTIPVSYCVSLSLR